MGPVVRVTLEVHFPLPVHWVGWEIEPLVSSKLCFSLYLSVCLCLSLCLSLSHTHTQTYTHTYTLTNLLNIQSILHRVGHHGSICAVTLASGAGCEIPTEREGIKKCRRLRAAPWDAPRADLRNSVKGEEANEESNNEKGGNIKSHVT